LSRMAEHGTCVVNRLGSCRAEKMSMYRFLGNQRVEPGLVVEAMRSHCRSVMKPRHYLCIQDTSEADYTGSNGRRDPDELGPVGNDVNQGLFIHPCMMVDAEEMCAVGFGDIELYIRDSNEKADPKQRKHDGLAARDKESKRWINGPNKSKGALPEGATMTVLGDREMDMYEAYVQIPDYRTDFLTRSQHNRVLGGGEKFYAFIDRQEARGQIRVGLRARKKRTAREALLEVKFGQVTIPRTTSASRDLPADVTIYWVEVREMDITVPKGEKRVHWRLLTSHIVETLEDALQIVEWYIARWQVEQLFRTLKSKGLNIEESQIETAHALKNLILMTMQTAINIMQLDYSRPGDSVYSAAMIFPPKTMLFLELLVRKYEGKTSKQKNPYDPHTIPWARWVIARMGGWDGYQSGSKAGPITIHRGLIKLGSMMEAVEIFAPEDV
jgi:hypothetical protein